MNDQALISAAALVMACLNVWGVFILNGINGKFNRIEEKIDKFISREEVNDRLKEHMDMDNALFTRERDARHNVADAAQAQFLNHDRRLTLMEERVENLRRGRRVNDTRQETNG